MWTAQDRGPNINNIRLPQKQAHVSQKRFHIDNVISFERRSSIAGYVAVLYFASF